MDCIETHEVTCGNSCGHFDYLNQCCWLSLWHKQEGDYCDYELREWEGMILTPKEVKELRSSEQKLNVDISRGKVNDSEI